MLYVTEHSLRLQVRGMYVIPTVVVVLFLIGYSSTTVLSVRTAPLLVLFNLLSVVVLYYYHNIDGVMQVRSRLHYYCNS